MRTPALLVAAFSTFAIGASAARAQGGAPCPLPAAR